MTRTATDSRDLTARQRARRAMADQLEKARKRETTLAEVFTAIDTLDAAHRSLGTALTELRGLGIAQAELAELSGLSTREVSAAIKASKTRSTQNTEHQSTDDNAAPGTANHAGETSPDPGHGTDEN